MFVCVCCVRIGECFGKGGEWIGIDKDDDVDDDRVSVSFGERERERGFWVSCEGECEEVQGSKPNTGSSCGWKLCGGYWESNVLWRLPLPSRSFLTSFGKEKQLRMRRVTWGEFRGKGAI